MSRRLLAWCVASGIVCSLAAAAYQSPASPTGPPPPPSSARPARIAERWVGHAARIEELLKTAKVVRIEDVGTGVTHPRRAFVAPGQPFDSFLWKVLPPGRPNGHWESYKSEIAAYELDKLLGMKMVPPAVERSVNGETGAAILWIPSVESVKQAGSGVPSGPRWGTAARRMMMFDNLIANIDRNAGNILIGPPGELILIDHSRAFVADTSLPHKFERVDETLWRRMTALTRGSLAPALRPWLDDDAIDAMLKRRERMADIVKKLVAKNGQAAVIIP